MSIVADFRYQYVPGSSGRTLLLLHGTGGNEQDLLGLGHQLDPTASLLSPRGRVLENGMPRFFRRLAEGVFDIEDLKFRTHELANFVVAASSELDFDAGDVTAVGFSNGANFAASLLLLRPEILRAAILLRPMVPLVPEALPDLGGVRVGIAAGTMDPIASVAETRRLEALLVESGAEAEVRFAEAGHNLTQADLVNAKSWMEAFRS
ncbi:alpha/beta hydrolase [bacterium]|nr:MAG: alpha/beta hydrolase [bacterium]